MGKSSGSDAILDEIFAHGNGLLFDFVDGVFEGLPVIDQHQRLARQVIQQAGGRGMQDAADQNSE